MASTASAARSAVSGATPAKFTAHAGQKRKRPPQPGGPSSAEYELAAQIMQGLQNGARLVLPVYTFVRKTKRTFVTAASNDALNMAEVFSGGTLAKLPDDFNVRWLSSKSGVMGQRLISMMARAQLGAELHVAAWVANVSEDEAAREGQVHGGLGEVLGPAIRRVRSASEGS